jgi:hypothetical protein
MKKLTISRKGMIFAAIAILLAGAVVTGYALRQDTANELAKVDQSQDERTKEPAAEPKTDPGLRVAEGYLLVPEWGVKIPLSASDAGAYYELDTSIEQPASNPTNFIVYTKEADALTSPIGVSCKGEYVAYMLRLPKDDPRWQPSTDATDGNVSPLFGIRTIVGDYQYAVSTKKQYGPQCWATSAKDADYQVDEATAQKFNDIARAFAADFKNIQAQ